MECFEPAVKCYSDVAKSGEEKVSIWLPVRERRREDMAAVFCMVACN